MTSPTSPTDSKSKSFRSVTRIIIVADLTHFTALARDRDDMETAAFLDAFYLHCENAIGTAGGRIVKFMGDACLAVFDGEAAENAIDAVLALREHVNALAATVGLPMELGANIHRDTIVEGEFGPAGKTAFDVVGKGVNTTFLLGRGAGIRLSEPMYRQLPSHRRSPWKKRQFPTTYEWPDESATEN